MTSPFWGNCPGLCDGLGHSRDGRGSGNFREIETFAMMTNTCPFLCDPLGNTVRIRFECTTTFASPCD